MFVLIFQICEYFIMFTQNSSDLTHAFNVYFITKIRYLKVSPKLFCHSASVWD